MKDWKKHSAGPISDHHIFKLQTMEVEDPRDGKVYPRVTLDCPDWANVIALTPDGELVLIRQFRFGTWSTTLEIPGGMLDPGEAPLVAAARELEEETGYRPKKIVQIGVTEPNPAIQNNRLHHFLATGCERVHQGRPDEGEDIEIALVPEGELDGLVRSGAITHSLVITALYFWRRFTAPG